MDWARASAIGWLFNGRRGSSERLIPRWLFLRALGLIYFSAFFSLIFQVRGLVGLAGILPAGSYLQAVAQSLGHWQRLWHAPTVLWVSSGPEMLSGLCWLGMIASVLLALNLWPRGMLVVCFVCFLSFVSAAQDLFLLQWEWFRIYFESGAVKLLSGDSEWRHFTAMDEYYQNGPLPTWIGWYVQHLPHWFHATTVYATLALELGLVWMLFLPRRWRIICFFIVTPWQIGVILTANYTFLNYLVLAMGLLLLEDRYALGALPGNWRQKVVAAVRRERTEKTAPEKNRWAGFVLTGMR